jgi:hypothetical protein
MALNVCIAVLCQSYDSLYFCICNRFRGIYGLGLEGESLQGSFNRTIVGVDTN